MKALLKPAQRWALSLVRRRTTAVMRSDNRFGIGTICQSFTN